MSKKIDIEKHQANYASFLASKQTIILSFVDENGIPFSSCAPFIQHDGKFYVYISEVAEHFNLMNNSAYVDALFLADETATNNPFATERVRFLCTPKNLGNDNQELVFTKFDEAYGEKLMAMLRGLDFSLFELNPITGRYVVGFGLAFEIDTVADTFEHVVVDKSNK